MSAARHWRVLVDAASDPYRRSGRFAWHFARGKLRMDPVFRHLLATGLVAPRDRVLDIGCGQGVFASLLVAAGAQARRGAWPDEWACAPEGVRVVGIELMPLDVARARKALGGPADAERQADFVCGDMREVAFPEADVVVILDVLHYIDHAAQDALLGRVRAALAGGGRLALRVGDAAARRGFRASQWVDRIVTLVRGHAAAPTFCRSLDDWTQALAALGFRVATEPMHRGTPFANMLLVGIVDAPGAAVAQAPAAAVTATHASAPPAGQATVPALA